MFYAGTGAGTGTATGTGDVAGAGAGDGAVARIKSRPSGFLALRDAVLSTALVNECHSFADASRYVLILLAQILFLKKRNGWCLFSSASLIREC